MRKYLWALSLSFLSLYSASFDPSEFASCFYRPTQNLIYINFPKCGSTYMRHALAKNLTFPLFSSITEECVSNSHIIIVARDPRTRIVSSYLEVLKCRGDGPQLMKDMTFYLNRANVEESFLQFLIELKNGYFDPHVYPQHAILEHNHLSLDDVTFIMDLKTLKSDLGLFASTYNIHIFRHNQLPFHRGNAETKARVKKYIKETPHIQELIEEVCAKDIEFYDQCMKKRATILGNL